MFVDLRTTVKRLQRRRLFYIRLLEHRIFFTCFTLFSALIWRTIVHGACDLNLSLVIMYSTSLWNTQCTFRDDPFSSGNSYFVKSAGENNVTHNQLQLWPAKSTRYEIQAYAHRITFRLLRENAIGYLYGAAYVAKLAISANSIVASPSRGLIQNKTERCSKRWQWILGRSQDRS